ncbi:MAG: SH3 domain-containing protein [Eubacteriales bacterium]|nr:SH3 domain-containing protein [Eubacteriales bacterium]
MICVYSSDCTDFSNNGLGVVAPQSCTVTETLNGEWELTLVHPIDEAGKWLRLAEGYILRAPVPAAMTPQVGLVTQQYQTTTYDMQIYKVTTKSGPLHLRSGTGTNYKILGKYKKGSEVIVLNKTTSSWYEVTCPDGRHGYMSSDYLTFQRTEQQNVQTNVVFRNEVIEARQLRDQPFRIYHVMRREESTQAKALRDAEAAIEKATKAVAALEEEAIKALTGESRIDLSIINQILPKQKTALDQAHKEYQRIVLENQAEEESLTAKRLQITKTLEWAKLFDNASTEAKQMIIANIVEHVTVNRGYKIDVKLKLTARQFLEPDAPDTISAAS